MIKVAAFAHPSFLRGAGIALTIASLLAGCDAHIETDGSSGTGSGGSPSTTTSDASSSTSSTSSSTSSSTTSGATGGGAGQGGASGCLDDAACLDPGAPHCDPSSGACVACVVDTDCALGSVCAPGHVCVPGCSATQACEMGLACCGGTCVDIDHDLQHCGACDIACPPLPQAIVSCESGACTLVDCAPSFVNCNGLPADGCELNLLQGDACSCVPGETEPCYTGAPGTQNIGPCLAGFHACAPDGASWGECQAQTLPITEICGNNVDDDCNGQIDDVADIDQDGWTRCEGDCDEIGIVEPFVTILPKNINPGAVEIMNNGVDDDCDPTTSDTSPAPSCSPGALFAAVSPLDLAQAMDICQTTVLDPPLPQRKWGLLDASFLLADGSVPSPAQLATIQSLQTAALSSFGVNNPIRGATMAGLSTGKMRDAQGPDFVPNAPGSDLGGSSSPPASYLAAHGDLLPASGGCNGVCPSGAGAFDSVRLRLTLRVPTNAKAVSYDFRFFSAEYGVNSCSPYNDAFLALIGTTALGIPLDGNIAFDASFSPVLVNTMLFQSCVAQGCNTCPAGAGDLGGTGMELGGGTYWLTTDAPVVPGETMQLDLMVFDVTDGSGDSHVLLDNFRWRVPSKFNCGNAHCALPESATIWQ